MAVCAGLLPCNYIPSSSSEVPMLSSRNLARQAARTPLKGGVSSRHGSKATKKRRNCLRTWASVASAPAGLKEALQYKKLGESDLVISEVTLGTMTFGIQNTEKEAHEQLSYSFDNGINILDTAEMYPVPPKPELLGRTDQYIGTWLKTRARDKVIVATKVTGYDDRFPNLRSFGGTTRVDARNIKEAVEGNLRRLQTDYLDLLQIHWPDRYVPVFGRWKYDPALERESVPFEEQLRGLEAVIKEGKVRYIGVSNETSYGVMEFIRASETLGLPRIVSIQNSYSLLNRVKFECDLSEVCRRANVGLLAFSPLAGGVLSGKYLDPSSEGYKKGRLNLFPGYMARFVGSLSMEATKKYAQLAKECGMTPAALALAFCRDQSFVTSSIIGATTMEQLKENLVAWTLPRPLPKEVSKKIEEIFESCRDPPLSS